MGKSTSLASDSRLARLYAWANERLDLDGALALAKSKTVPQHKHSFWYYWGGISLFLFLIQAITGILLLVYYRPGPDAYNSVRSITYDIDFGWLIRSAHSWSANLMVGAVFVHMFSVFFMKTYRNPREFGWWSGLILLGLTMVFGFSGYLLPMDELSYFATKVGLDIPAKTPLIGEWLVGLIRGGPEVNETTVQRFFALHAVVLPAMFLPVLGFHLMLIVKHGSGSPPSEEAKPKAERESIPFFPNFFMKDMAMWLMALCAIAVLASMFPWPLHPQADPLAPAPEGIHPEWYFMSQFQLLKALGQIFQGNWAVFGELVGIGIFTIGGILWALIPLYDKDSKRAQRAKVATWFGLGALAGLVVLTIWGYVAL
ncbi:cytochrome bc complex cytochrome b subunit [bacterium]|nr:cytochrome bc complex cytochrome b subunit [bacterium]